MHFQKLNDSLQLKWSIPKIIAHFASGGCLFWESLTPKGITQHKALVKKIVSFLFLFPMIHNGYHQKEKNVRHFKKQNAPLLVEEKNPLITCLWDVLEFLWQCFTRECILELIGSTISCPSITTKVFKTSIQMNSRKESWMSSVELKILVVLRMDPSIHCITCFGSILTKICPIGSIKWLWFSTFVQLMFNMMRLAKSTTSWLVRYINWSRWLLLIGFELFVEAPIWAANNADPTCGHINFYFRL